MDMNEAIAVLVDEIASRVAKRVIDEMGPPHLDLTGMSDEAKAGLLAAAERPFVSSLGHRDGGLQGVDMPPQSGPVVSAVLGERYASLGLRRLWVFDVDSCTTMTEESGK